MALNEMAWVRKRGRDLTFENHFALNPLNIFINNFIGYQWERGKLYNDTKSSEGGGEGEEIFGNQLILNYL